MPVGLEAFDATVVAQGRGERGCEAAVGLAKMAFDNLLRNSPQYSGDFAAGWSTSVMAR